MALRVTAIHMSHGGTRHEHIESVRWWNEATGATTVEAVFPTMVSRIDGGEKVYVFDGRTRAEVGVVRPNYGRAYIRTYRDRVWTDNLLALPRF